MYKNGVLSCGELYPEGDVGIGISLSYVTYGKDLFQNLKHTSMKRK